MSSDPERPDLSVGVEFDVQGIAGLFYVIDGFLDMILPTEDNGKESANAKTERGKNVQPEDEKTRSQSRFDFLFDGNSRSDGTTKSKANKDRSQKPLFTVKPGGIAGYLCELHLIISRLSYRHQAIELTHVRSVINTDCVVRRHCGEDGHIRRLFAITCARTVA